MNFLAVLHRWFVRLGVLREEKSWADAIINRRVEYRLLLSVTLFAILSATLNYLLLVYPIFEEPEFSNSAVWEYLNSDFYKQESTAFSELLGRYNTGLIDIPPNDLTFIFPVRGVIVQHVMSPNPSAVPRADGGNRLVFKNDFKILLNWQYLIAYGFGLGCMVIYGVYIVLNRPPRALTKLEASVLNEHLSLGAACAPPRELASVETKLARIFARFHAFVLLINDRPRGAPGFKVATEYDVQDLMLPILRMEFGNVKREVWGPNIAGLGSRVDFQLVEEGVLIEIKKTSRRLRDTELAKQMLVDIAQYSVYPDLHLIVFFIYDPEGLIRNPLALLEDLEAQRKDIKVKVEISPRWHE
ncbi:hypothetical protein [Pseudomonas sp. NPDC088444]|uniref:PD-(D/E)XK nuclease domain-containing protein n=1 Tax=Pseudomonas sp. NPDC088444 TaxID=3364456 RepID=UPI0038516512